MGFLRRISNKTEIENGALSVLPCSDEGRMKINTMPLWGHGGRHAAVCDGQSFNCAVPRRREEREARG